MEIRKVEEGDREQFFALLRLFLDYAGNGVENIREMDTIWKNALDDEINYSVFCAADESRLLGIVSVTFGESSYKASPFAWCDDLFVLEECRRKGIATVLLQTVATYCKSYGCSNIMLGVGENEENVKSLYNRLGFCDMHNTIMTLPLN